MSLTLWMCIKLGLRHYIVSVLPPTDCVPDVNVFGADTEMGKLVRRLHKVFQEAKSSPQKGPPVSSANASQVRVALSSLGLRIGSQVVVGGVKVCATMSLCHHVIVSLTVRVKTKCYAILAVLVLDNNGGVLSSNVCCPVVIYVVKDHTCSFP